MRNATLQARDLGLRERNKRDKLVRICAAARDIFISQGFDNSTLREIARRADVGLGTLFSYVTDKRDLLFLINNDELRDMTEAAAAEFDPELPLGDSLLSLFSRHYEFFKRQPELSRTMLRELNFYDDTEQATRFQATRDRALGIVREAIRCARSRGALSAAGDDMHWAQLVFGIYQMELRAWLSSEPLDREQGLARLKASFILLAQGMGGSLWAEGTRKSSPPGKERAAVQTSRLPRQRGRASHK